MCVNVQVAGIAMIILGSVIQAEFSGYYGFFGNDVNSAAVFIIVIGIIIVIISFFGCCGAYRESHWMLITVTMHTLCNSSAVSLSVTCLSTVAMCSSRSTSQPASNLLR